MKTDLEVFVVVDANGDYATGTTADAAKEAYENDIGPLADADGFRVVRVNLSVPLPVVIEAAAEVEDDEPAEVAAAGQ